MKTEDGKSTGMQDFFRYLGWLPFAYVFMLGLQPFSELHPDVYAVLESLVWNSLIVLLPALLIFRGYQFIHGFVRGVRDASAKSDKA